MPRHLKSISCPVCEGPLQPRVLSCGRCDVRVEGNFEVNEFAGLEERLLHFLRIFVHCEGRIKEMEKALGVSYPTVKGMMTELKEALCLPVEASEAPPPSSNTEAAAVLDQMARGEITYKQGLEQLKKGKT